eukprot:TRINITY_DN522_c0_g2_i1.p1 TRINITY_DN522_c0_g2~~TRINITY_DN522_c0_g2_i1.p1  ORF type:complete len:233 (-),score=86.92 TRINITY_DN522_c0_g2_i1:105-803(-)
MGSLFMKDCVSPDKNTAPESQKQGQGVKRRPVQASEADVTIMKLKMTQDKFYEQRKHLEHSLEKAEAEALKYARANKKDLAIHALQRKKLFAEYLEDAYTKYNFIQQQIALVEQKQMEAEMLPVLREANELLQEMDKMLKLDEMEEIVENIKASEEKNREVDRILKSHNISAQDKDLQDEYDRIEAEILGKQLEKAPPVNIPAGTQMEVEAPQPAAAARRDELDERMEALAN